MTSAHPWLRRRTRPRPATPADATTATLPTAHTGDRPTPGAPVTGPAGTAPEPSRGASTGPAPAGTSTRASTGPRPGGAGLQLSFGGATGTPPVPATAPSPARTASGAGASGTPSPSAVSGAPAAQGPSARVAARLAARAARVRPFPAPDPRDVQVLGAETPVVRVDRRRSAVGTLAVSGCTSTVWESVDHVVGALTLDGRSAGRPVQTPGNRPLVGFDGDVALVTLRHVRTLRRALFINRGGDRTVVALHDGTTLAVDPGTADTMTITALSVIDGEVELRAEPFPRVLHDGEVFAAFGFTLSAPPIGA